MVIVMDLKIKLRFLDLAGKFLRGDLQNLCAYDFTPHKSASKDYPPDQLIPHTQPEKTGIPSSYIESFYRDLSAAKGLNPHGALIIRQGKIIAQGYWAPYSAERIHELYSLSKTFAGTAVGLAIEEGFLTLDDTLQDIFPDKWNALFHLFQKPITIRHLLTMSTGIFFNEAATVLEKNWLQSILESECAFPPGTNFSYNSLNTYLLSAIIKRKTGEGLMEFLKPRLLDPLHITSAVWDLCPMGVEKGGWGLSMTLYDAAKLGVLYLDRGIWKYGDQPLRILPEWWVQEATSQQIATHSTASPQGYGYQIWTFPAKGAYEFNGIFNQHIIVLPQHDMVIALFCGNKSLFPSNHIVDLIVQYFGDQHVFPTSVKPVRKDVKSLAATLEKLTLHQPCPPVTVQSFWDKLMRGFPRAPHPQPPYIPDALIQIEGKTFRFEKNTAGLLPLVLQAIHTNFTPGISSVRLSFAGGHLTFTVTEGQNTNIFTAGLDKTPLYSRLTFAGETYIVAAIAQLGKTASGRDQITIQITFVETPCTRVLRCIIQDHSLLIRMDEIPSAHDVMTGLGQMMNNGHPLHDKMISAFAHNTQDRLHKVLLPRIIGHME